MDKYSESNEKITYQDLSQKTGLSKATLEALGSRPTYNTTLSTIETLCHALECDLTDLLTFEKKMTNKISRLAKLTGLTGDELADALEKNPRAYMAVKGAVAEKHLARILRRHLKEGYIKKIKEAAGDFDKDFYIEDNSGETLSIECKNIEVIKTTKKAEKISYLAYLIEKRLMSEERILEIANTVRENDINSISEFAALTASELTAVFRHLPQHLRESGITRYEFSAQQVALKSCKETTSYKLPFP